MPETAKALQVHDPLNPEENILAGAAYVAKLLEKYHGRTELALAAYNAGPRAVLRHKGIPPYPETRRYIQKVLLCSRTAHLHELSEVPFRNGETDAPKPITPALF